MKAAAEVLLGTHDFTSFCGNRHFKKSAVRTIYEIRIEEKKDELDISFTGNGFLQNMVRILTGTLLEVGTEKREVREMKEILEGRNRSLAGPVAAAMGPAGCRRCGLCGGPDRRSAERLPHLPLRRQPDLQRR